MTRTGLSRIALAACAVALAAPVAALAQLYPQQPLPMYPQQMPAGERVYSFEGAPVFTPGDEFGGAAAQNNRESRQYESLMRSNPKFRASRMARECGSIADPQGQAQCLSTFDYGQ